MHCASDAGFEMVFAHRGGNQKVDFTRSDPSLFKRKRTSARRSIVERDIFGPPTASLDTSHGLKEPWTNTKALIGLSELFVDPCRAHDLGRIHMRDRPHMGSGERNRRTHPCSLGPDRPVHSPVSPRGLEQGVATCPWGSKCRPQAAPECRHDRPQPRDGL